MSDRAAPPVAAVERTALAWFRTAVSMAILGLLMVRAGTESDHPLAIGLGGIVLALAGGLGWLPTQATGPAAHAAAGSARRMAMAGAAMSLSSIAALAVVLLT